MSSFYEVKEIKWQKFQVSVEAGLRIKYVEAVIHRDLMFL